MTRPDRRKDKYRLQRVFKACEWDGVSFESYRPDHRFCCKACNNAWHAEERRLQNMLVPPELRPRVAELVKEYLATPGIEPIQIRPQAMPVMIECEACGCERPQSIKDCPRCIQDKI